MKKDGSGLRGAAAAIGSSHTVAPRGLSHNNSARRHEDGGNARPQGPNPTTHVAGVYTRRSITHPAAALSKVQAVGGQRHVHFSAAANSTYTIPGRGDEWWPVVDSPYQHQATSLSAFTPRSAAAPRPALSRKRTATDAGIDACGAERRTVPQAAARGAAPPARVPAECAAVQAGQVCGGPAHGPGSRAAPVDAPRAEEMERQRAEETLRRIYGSEWVHSEDEVKRMITALDRGG